MTVLRYKTALLACATVFASSVSAHAAPANAAVPASATDAPSAGPATPTDQSTSANRKGQANDAGALSTADIIVIGSSSAQAAPITASLTTTQPQAAVSREYIDNIVATADFNQIVALTPGVTITGTGNGVGFSESKVQIRGFQDGEYNVTYDSIPFADTNNPTHHSTAFFPSNTIETVVVDRGPGNASQLGQATYGGNINIYSRGVSDKAGAQAELTLGNFNTVLGRVEYQTGAIDKLGGAKFVFAGQYLQSDGALTFSPVNSKNLFAKAVLPIGSANTLTLLGTWNRNFYYQSDVAKGATCGSATTAAIGRLTAADTAGNALTQLTGENCAATSDIVQFGRNFSLTNDPTKPSNFRYNRTDKTTDFSIVRLQSEIAEGLTLDNRFYVYGYTNNTQSGNGTIAASVGATANVPVLTVRPGTVVTGFTGAGTVASPFRAVAGPATDVSGYFKLNKYRTLGYIGQVNYDFSLGKIRAGGWFEHAATDRNTLNVNLTTGALNFNQRFADGTAANAIFPSRTLANISYLQHSGWNQYQLFGEFEFHPFEGLAITPGVKYVHFTRSIDAAVNQGSTRSPISTEATWTKTLPFATINYAATPNWSFYGQYAQGFYVPDLSSFYSPSTTAADQATQAQKLSDLQPQSTTNYQIGSVWHGDLVSVDLDAYLIEVNNKIASSTNLLDPPGTLVNIGKVRYKGVEGQISVMPVHGLTLFANAAYNDARNLTTNAQIARASKFVGGLGAFYNNRGFRASFTQKFTGAAYATERANATTTFAIPTTNERLYRIKPYSIGDFSVSQEIGDHLRLGITVSNVFNDRSITAISSSSSGAPTAIVNGVTYQTGYGQLDAFNFLPPRSAQVDVRFKF